MLPDDMDPVTAKMYMFARKLRAKAEWDYADHFYTTEAEREVNAGKREFASDLAQLMDEAFDFDSELVGQDYDNHRQGKGFIP